ncbi:MAG TPA: M48 family metalloprotease [Blastocatellia bacterium]|nr:M48 family metalloprotease [Blastocatellia bacterium]
MKIGLIIALVFIVANVSHAQPLPTANDVELSEYLTRLADNIAARTQSQFSGTVTVLASDSINAYTLPSGELCVTHGLLKAVNNEAEIVFVMAQQLSSWQLHRQPPAYAQPQLKRPSAGHKILVGLASGALIVFGGPLGARVGVMIVAREIGHTSTPVPVNVQAMQASFVTDADRIAMEYLHEAGYDPEAAITMLEKLRAARPKGYVRQSELPPPPITFQERLRLLRHRIVKLEPKNEYLLDSSAFKTLQTRLGKAAPSTSADKPQLQRQPLSSSSNGR